MTHKDAWNEAYNNAIDDGHTESEAERIADHAADNHWAGQIDDAMDRRDLEQLRNRIDNH